MDGASLARGLLDSRYLLFSYTKMPASLIIPPGGWVNVDTEVTFISATILGGNVEVGVFVAMMMGAIPALLLMFYMLRPFEGLYADRSTFNSFVIGMAIGVMTGVMHVAIDPYVLLNVPSAILVFVIGFAIFDQFLRVVLFNSPRFSGKMETTFYATAFGLGYSSMLTALWFYRSFTHPEIEVNTWVVASYLAASFAFAVIHGSTGMLVGFGASIGEVWRYGILGVAMEAILNFLWYLALISSIYTPPGVYSVWEMTVISMAAATAYGYFVLRWTMKRVVPELLPTETMRLRRRIIRKMSRDGTRK